MDKKRFIYNHEYYEYGKEELSIYLYENEIPEELSKLLSARAELIVRIADFVNAMTRAGNKPEEDKDINSAIDTLYRGEKEISECMLEENVQLEWYHPTNPKKEWMPWEEQKVSVCTECGMMYDLDTPLLVERNGHFISECPKCKSNKLILDNKYLCQGKKLEKESDLLRKQGHLEKSIQVRKQEIEKLQKVDIFYDEEYKKAIYRQICAYGDISVMYIEMERFTEALEEVENAAACGRILSEIDHSKGFCGVMSEIFLYRMNIKMKLPGYSMDDIFSDYNIALKYNTENYQEYVRVTEISQDISEEEKSAVFRRIEEIRLKTYAGMIAYYFQKNWSWKAKEILKELKAYLPTCRYTSESELIKYRELVDSTLQEIDPPRNEGCYIATAVYGDYDAPQVMVLRRFRDTVLQKKILGRLFIKAYYKLSPPMAERLKNTVRLNGFVRSILDRFIESIGKN